MSEYKGPYTVVDRTLPKGYNNIGDYEPEEPYAEVYDASGRIVALFDGNNALSDAHFVADRLNRCEELDAEVERLKAEVKRLRERIAAQKKQFWGEELLISKKKLKQYYVWYRPHHQHENADLITVWAKSEKDAIKQVRDRFGDYETQMCRAERVEAE